LYASPAPVVSTTLTGREATRMSPSGVIQRLPLAPSFTIAIDLRARQKPMARANVRAFA
jgi:hypothetical protein